jgi:predicted DNA-binding WGR domain protein
MDEVDSMQAAGGVAFEHVVRFESVDRAQQRFRFYELRWHTTLWGGVALVRGWGRLGTPGHARVREYPDRASAAPDAERAVRRRLRRGYRLVAVR